MSNPETAHKGAERARKALAEAMETENDRARELSEFIIEVRALERKAVNEVLAELDPLRHSEGSNE